jgi:putative membrane protein
MVAAHTDSTAKLKSTVAADPSGITISDALNAEQQSTLEDLKSKKGAEFDTAYRAAQVGGHEKTLAALKDYSKVGDNAALKAFAQELIPTVTEHLDKAKGLK